MSDFYFRTIKKLHLADMLSRILLLRNKSVTYNNDIINEAYEYLNGKSPNPDKSCISKNYLSKDFKYDLQIVIPAYNAELYIERCIDSILNKETKFNILIVVVNDGSTDKTAEILKKYASTSNVLIISQENRGFSGARNRGIEKIYAKYVTFLDSDDELLDIDHILKYALDIGADIVEGGFTKFNDNGDFYTKRYKNQIVDAQNNFYGYPWGKIIRSQLFKNIIFPEEYWFEDTIMAFIIFPLCVKGATSSTIFYHYRINPSGITAKFRGCIKSIDSYWITERLLKDRKLMRLENDEKFAETMLLQIKNNCKRISKIGNMEVEHAVFILTIHLWEKYFPNYVSMRNPLVLALKKRNFLAYKTACYS